MYLYLSNVDTMKPSSGIFLPTQKNSGPLAPNTFLTIIKALK